MESSSPGSRKQGRAIVLLSRPTLIAGALLLVCAATAWGQSSTPPAQGSQAPAQAPSSAAQDSPTLKHRSAADAKSSTAPEQDPLAFLGDTFVVPPPPIELVVAQGVPLRVILKKPLPIKSVGEPIQAYLAEPIYAFDRVVVPEGTEVDGHITELVSPSKIKRTAAYLNEDFSPHRAVKFEFDTLVLKDGSRMPLHTKVLPNIGPVVHLEANPQAKNSTVHKAKGAIRKEWDQVKAEAKPSRLWIRAKEFVWGEWPYHKQQLPAGSVFDVELEQPLDFGIAIVPAAEMGAMGQLPAENSAAYARLTTSLSSATAHVGTPVVAVITRPVFSSDKKLLLPVGTELQGIVVQARPARRLHRNGQLHFTLQRIQLPSGTPEPIEMALEGIEVPKASHIQLDTEGGTSVADDKQGRVLSTALSVMIASSTLDGGREHHQVDSTGDPGNRSVAGASGYKLIGFVLAFGIQSRIYGQVLGFLGAGESAYVHFIVRGQDLVLLKDTPIEVSFGQHRRPSGP
jgi:hypothetical protein